MKYFAALLLIGIMFSCSNSTKEKMEEKTTIQNFEKHSVKTKKTESIIAERIDGPANIRNKPNGEVWFELYDNALVEVGTEKEGWHEILIHMDIQKEELEMDSIVKGRYIIVDKDTVGRVIKTHSVGTGDAGKFQYVMLFGYTHKNNIKKETVIENAFLKEFVKNDRSLEHWTVFIRNFNLDTNAFTYKYSNFYNYENAVDDPSPGFRMVLLFRNKKLAGFIHSREIQTNNTITHKLDWSYYITFFKDEPGKDQLDLVNYMNEFIRGVD